MPISKPIYQLTLGLDLEDPDAQMGKSADDAKVRSETARAALNALSGEAAPWKTEYLNLVEGGWHWRVAAYIAWAASPKNTRTPKTQDELATQHLGLTSDRAINTWRRKNPAIDEMVAVLQAAPLFEHRAEIYAALVQVATSPEYKGHNDRKLALELLGDYMPTAKLEAILKQKGSGNNPDVEDEDKLALLENAVGEIRPEMPEEIEEPKASEAPGASEEDGADEEGDDVSSNA